VEGESLETSCYTYPIVYVGTAAEHGAVIDKTHFAVHVQFLLDRQTSYRRSHGSVRHCVLAVEAILGLALLSLFFQLLQLLRGNFFLTWVGGVVFLVSVTIFADRRVHTFTHDGFGNTALDILVCKIGLLLEFFQSGRLVDSVVCAQGEYDDML
jgi:hypothetical protein